MILNVYSKSKYKITALKNFHKYKKYSIFENYHHSTYNQIIITDIPEQYSKFSFLNFVRAIYFSSMYDYSKYN